MHGTRERRLLEQGWRYTLVGLMCAVLNYAIMLAVDFAAGHYLLGTVLAFSVVTPLGYASHSWFTFAEPFKLRAFLRFSGAVASTYPIAIVMLAILCSGLRLRVAIAVPIATIALFFWNFVAAHWAILPRLNLGPTIEVDRQPAGNDKH